MQFGIYAEYLMPVI